MFPHFQNVKLGPMFPQLKVPTFYIPVKYYISVKCDVSYCNFDYFDLLMNSFEEITENLLRFQVYSPKMGSMPLHFDIAYCYHHCPVDGRCWPTHWWGPIIATCCTATIEHRWNIIGALSKDYGAQDGTLNMFFGHKPKYSGGSLGVTDDVSPFQNDYPHNVGCMGYNGA